jgi:serine protease DegQ
LLRPGEQVRVGFIREGRQQTVTATLGELSTATVAAAEEPEESSGGFAELAPSFEGADIVENEPGKGVAGLLVARVIAGSPASQQGLRQGDVITNINRVPVRTLADATAVIKSASSIVLYVRRGNRSQLILMR